MNKIAKKIMEKMVKFGMVTAVIFAAMLVFSPCLLIFTESRGGDITVWNFVGLAYLLLLVWICKRTNFFD